MLTCASEGALLAKCLCTQALKVRAEAFKAGFWEFSILSCFDWGIPVLQVSRPCSHSHAESGARDSGEVAVHCDTS